MYNKDYGILNYILSFFGLESVAWLNNPETSLYAVVVVMIWMKVGYNMVILLAGLQGIPKSLYEAAEIDGASKVKQFFSITLPMLTPTLFFVSVMTLISTFQVFDIIFMMVEKFSIAINDSMSLVYLFYRYAFEFNEKGYAAAMAVILFFIIIIVTIIQFRIKKKWEHE
jgi:multiple sugar transport system permease protein